MKDLLLPPGPAWHDQAACTADEHMHLVDVFGGTVTRRARVAQAIAICQGCPVREECREAGVDERRGVWGGELRR